MKSSSTDDPFSFVKAINKKTDPPESMEGYSSFITNHSFSAFADTVLLANEMNRFPDLPKQMQYDFYYHAVKKGNRFSKWFKKSKNDTLENIQMLQSHYGYSEGKAQQALDILTDDQLDYIRASMGTGGR
jgi:hypothetical protein